jgi:ABC-type branched-subunit amino acid transport system substrate-binding protein
VAASGVALLVVGCGSSTTSGSGATGGTTTSKSDLVIMAAAPGESNVYGLGPVAGGGLNVAVKSINAAGGIGGHMLKLVSCNDGEPLSNAQGELACGQQAAAQKPMALVGSWVFVNAAAFFGYLKPASIPSIAFSDAGGVTDTNPLSWVIQISSRVVPAFDVLAGAKAGCKKIAQFIPASGGETSAPLEAYFENVGKAVGVQVYPISVPPTQTDFAPMVARAESDRADCIDQVTASTTLAPILTAIKDSGKSLRIVANGLIDSQPSLAAAGPTANGTVIASSTYPAGYLKSAAVTADFAKYGAGIEQNALQVSDWEIVQIFAMAAKKAIAAKMPLTPASIEKELGTLSNISLGVQPPMNFSAASPIPGSPRDFGESVTPYTWNNGKFTPIGATITLPSSVKPPATAGSAQG